MQGVCIVLEQCLYDGALPPDTHQLHGQLISAVRQTVCAALKKHPLRLLTAMYKCSVQTNSQNLGKVHAVLAQRRSKVLSFFYLQNQLFPIVGNK
jgi:ribosome assembly protein 1